MYKTLKVIYRNNSTSEIKLLTIKKGQQKSHPLKLFGAIKVITLFFHLQIVH